jgi:hypothetical protein
MPVHQVVGVIAMRDRFMAAFRAMSVTLLMSATIVTGRSRCRIAGVDCDHMLIHMRFMRMVQVAVVEVVRVTLVLNGCVPARWAVLMRMAFVNIA